MYPRANIRDLCPGGLNTGAGGGLNPGAYIRGAYIRGDISGGLYSVTYIRAAYIQGAYIPHRHTDSEQVNKRLSPTNLKELESRFTCPYKRQN